ncbi:MAG: hypothetical protein ACUVX8_10860 [Candidatus Zipacnadales bacterium]
MKLSTMAPIAILAAGLLVRGGISLGRHADRLPEPYVDNEHGPSLEADTAGPQRTSSPLPWPAPPGPWGGPQLVGPTMWNPGPGKDQSEGNTTPSASVAPSGTRGPSAANTSPSHSAPQGHSKGSQEGPPTPGGPTPAPGWGWSPWPAPAPQNSLQRSTPPFPQGGFPGWFEWSGGGPIFQAPRSAAQLPSKLLTRELTALDAVAEDLNNASIALREKNHEQVREILRNGAQKLARVSEAWRGLTDQFAEEPVGSMGEATMAAEKLTPVVVPAEEPTNAAERAALEEQIRVQLRALREPYERLKAKGIESTEVEKLLRACREAVNTGALCSAAAHLNAASAVIEQLLMNTSPVAFPQH